MIRLHFKPVGNLQIAMWLETPDGKHFRDVFVTQTVGKLGLGNRSGRPDFLSSWRFPYGPRPGVLPIWAHRRGKTYPKVIFFEDDPEYWDSLGWHETTSSAETYYCRPLTQSEDDQILDVMSCPSPGGFSTDKGYFDPGGAVVYYPPRNDLTAVDPIKDHPDIAQYEQLNDLDAVTGATPPAGQQIFKTVRLRESDLSVDGLVAFIEVSLEHDENADWEFDREDDHWVDQKLATYGVEWRGQPSVVYRVELDPSVEGSWSTANYFGYGDEQGASGAINPPDATIGNGQGSGGDRLKPFELGSLSGRFVVTSSGWQDSGDQCADTLPAVTGLVATPRNFSTVTVQAMLPTTLVAADKVSSVRVYVLNSEQPLTADNLSSAITQDFSVCAVGQVNDCDVTPDGDGRVTMEVDQLFGDYTYQLGVAYQDTCGGESDFVATSATTPTQEFQVVDSFCVVATAAYGASWFNEVAALRHARDAYLRQSELGRTFVASYYAFGPPVAGVIGRSALLRAATRGVLKPLADVAILSVSR